MTNENWLGRSAAKNVKKLGLAATHCFHSVFLLMQSARPLGRRPSSGLALFSALGRSAPYGMAASGLALHPSLGQPFTRSKTEWRAPAVCGQCPFFDEMGAFSVGVGYCRLSEGRRQLRDEMERCDKEVGQ